MNQPADDKYILKVKVVTNGKQPADVIVNNMLFSVSLSYSQSNAILAHHPNKEFLGYPGIKAWYCGEAKENWMYMTKNPWKHYIKRLKPEEFLIHSHADPRFRVPIATHWQDLRANSNEKRVVRAVALINSHEPVWKQILKRRFEAIRRSRFVVHNLIDLYGSRKNWQKYRAGLFSSTGLPPNYCGELAGISYATGDLHQFLSKYRVYVCFENAYVPYYFTERFVDAVQGGCIPIYHAHPSVAAGVLAGAKWVDPADFDFNAERTIKFALQSEIMPFWEANTAWLKNEVVKSTSWLGVHKRIGEILLGRINQPRQN